MRLRENLKASGNAILRRIGSSSIGNLRVPLSFRFCELARTPICFSRAKGAVRKSIAHRRPVPMSENLLFLIRENFVEFFRDFFFIQILPDDAELYHSVADFRIPIFFHLRIFREHFFLFGFRTRGEPCARIPRLDLAAARFEYPRHIGFVFKPHDAFAADNVFRPAVRVRIEFYAVERFSPRVDESADSVFVFVAAAVAFFFVMVLSSCYEIEGGNALYILAF